jgi:hypothetical protein
MKYKCFFALLAAGLAFGACQYFHPEGLSLGPGNEMVMEARTLVQEGIFGDPFRSMKTGPTATNPPLYPLFLAFCIWLYPTSSFHFITAVQAANLIANGKLPVAAVFGVIFLLHPLLYYVVVSEERYRLPILWLSCLAGGYLLTPIPTRRRV